MIVDVGTGDGRAVIARAAAEPRSLVIGLDAATPALAETSRRAAKGALKGGFANALFVRAAAEAPPAEVVGRADLVTILFPWGSLLRGVLGRDAEVARGVASLLRPAGRIEAYVSVTPRDGADLPLPGEPGTAGEIDAAWASVGLCVESWRPASAAEVAALPSSWARRLRTGTAESSRPVWRLELRRASSSP